MSSSATNFCRSCKRLEGVIQMKVLFAVNSESISDAIIKKYQKDYREILSYKNVYYFNAIQKEIQKDKSYDRIVISADLEPFSNNNYESIDKFIFEKLDGISDDAHDRQGNEISIILICSDRHTKGSSFLVKLFGLGIYNALLGNDRSMEEVCRLINKPRTKKEAKMYYKIDTDDVNYRTESEDEVDELQIQNILYHFRKLGKNVERYAGSFENIAAQYTDEQLKIIINCLPPNVKRILEETSLRYQEIMEANGMIVKGVKSNQFADKEAQKRTGLKIDIIENKLNQTKMNGPIVIPNSVKAKGIENSRKTATTLQNQQNLQTTQRPQNKTMTSEQVNQEVKRRMPQMRNDQNSESKINHENEKMVRLPNGKIVRKTVKPERKVNNIPENNEVKVIQKHEIKDELEDLDFTVAEKPKSPYMHQQASVDENENLEQPKRGRGRPRKNPVEPPKPKGKRGRPRKNPVGSINEREETQEGILGELPDLEKTNKQPLNFDSFEDDFLPTFDEEVKNDTLEEFIEQEDEIMLPQNSVPSITEDLEEIQLPELDELEDLEDEFSSLTEEAFDEFNDYDEYGQYETATTSQKKEENVDELYAQDILSNELEEVETNLELPEFDMTDLEEFERADESTFEMPVETEEDDNMLLSDFEEEDINLFGVDEPVSENLFEIEEPVMQEPKLVSEPVQQTQKDEIAYLQNSSGYASEALESIETPIDYSMSNLNSLMTKDKKIVTFLGSTKNGVSFLVNNLAEVFASVGINTAILDMTQNRNSYYIYTQNEESLRQIAYKSIENLQNGIANGIKVKQNLTVYTALPNDGKEYTKVEEILATLVQNHSLILIDCDFDTNPAYFASCQEIYLVQSMDILTIQPLTAFLRELKTQGVFEPEKVRVVINKELKVRGLTNKAIIGGMSSYNDPSMSFMTELFHKEDVKYCSIPFEEIAYSKYLEGMLNCKVSISGYSKNFMNKLRILGDMVYPLTSRQTYSSNMKQTYAKNNFSNSMNDTLNKMKKKY